MEVEDERDGGGDLSRSKTGLNSNVPLLSFFIAGTVQTQVLPYIDSNVFI